jgi:Tfp pilus assembly PilM family ATPase
MSLAGSLNKIKVKLSHAFPAVDYLALSPVGIDITGSAVRLVKLEKSEDGYIPSIHKEVNFKELVKISDMDSVEQSDIEAVVTVLKKLKNEYKLKYVVASLPEEKNYIYRITLPTQAIENIPSAIRFSLEENVPLSVKEVNFDYEIVEIDKEGIDTVVSVFPKDVVRFYTEILKKAGLTPLSFQSESVALSNAIITNQDKELYLLIRMLKDRVNVAVSESGAVQYTSTIMIDTEKVTNDLQGQEAKKLIQELNKILIYWFTSRKDAKEQHKIEKAIVVGKYALAEGLEDVLEGGLKLDVLTANPWTNCFDPQKHVPELNKEDALEYSVAIGLALKGIEFK